MEAGFLQIASTALTILGGMRQASAMESQAEYTRRVAAANQRVLDEQAKQEEAVSQRSAERERRKGELALSRAMAVAAASGGGTQDLGKLFEGIVGETETNAGYALYGGTERAKGLRHRGAVGVAEGEHSARNLESRANATLLSTFSKALPGVGDLYSRFKGDGPPSSGARDWFLSGTRDFGSNDDELWV